MARTTRRRVPAASSPAAGEPTAETPRRVRENLPRPTAPAPLFTGGPRAAIRKKRNPLGFLSRLQPRFVADVIAELRKVTWPSFQETRYLTIVVAIVSLAVGIFLGSIDFVFGWTVEKLFF